MHIFSLHIDTLKYLLDCDKFSNTNYAIWKNKF